MVQWTISSDERPERKRRAKRCSLRQMRELEAARKVRCLLGFSCCVAGGAQADPRDDSLSAMLRGSAISDRTQRLICYDTAVARVPGALNNVAPPPAAAPTPFVASDVPPPRASHAGPPALQFHGPAVRNATPSTRSARGW